MPHSSHLGITLALDHVVRLQPRRVLDVGAGYGKWGYLIREALDFIPGRLDRPEWQVTIDGVEPSSNDSPLWAWVYDRVLRADVTDVEHELAGYDVVVLGDVIEHLAKDRGRALLRTLLAHNRNAIVMTPLHFFEQEVDGNPYETHQSHWTLDDFAEWRCDYDVVGGSALVAALAGRGATYPAAADARASRTTYRLPGMRKRGAAARVLKQALRRSFAAAGASR